MAGRNKSLLYYLDTISDACILFVSYVISMYIRYFIMDSEPGLPILSTPYLLVAAVYSVIMACIFSYVQSGNENRIGKDMRLYSKLNGGNGYKILAVNMIGCLFLMSFFYIVGVVYFSRWALVLFWGVSSAGILIKEGIVQNWISKEGIRKQYGIRTVVVGDGELAREYIRSACSYSSYGRNIVGYVGTHKEKTDKEKTDKEKTHNAKTRKEKTHNVKKQDALFDDGEFDDCEFDDYESADYEWEGSLENGIAGENWVKNALYLGELSDLKRILENQEVDEVILALEDVSREEADWVARISAARGVELGLVPQYSSMIPAGAPIYEFGDMKVISLNKKNDSRTRDTLWLGLVLSAALLTILLILNLFGIGEMQRIAVYEDYKCIVFGVAGVFLYSYLMTCLKGKAWANTKRAVISFVSCSAAALIYEMIYRSGLHYSERFLDDVRVIFFSVVICWCVTGFVRRISKDFPMAF